MKLFRGAGRASIAVSRPPAPPNVIPARAARATSSSATATDHSFGRLPPAPPQDASLRRARRRPFPGAIDAQHRGRTDRPHHRPSARPQRGPHRGAGASRMTSATRPSVTPARMRSRGARRRRRVRPQCPHHRIVDPARDALSRFRRPQPQLGDARGARQANGPVAEPTWAIAESNSDWRWSSALRRASRRRSRRSPTTSPMTITISTTASGGLLDVEDSPAAADRAPVGGVGERTRSFRRESAAARTGPRHVGHMVGDVLANTAPAHPRCRRETIDDVRAAAARSSASPTRSPPRNASSNASSTRASTTLPRSSRCATRPSASSPLAAAYRADPSLLPSRGDASAARRSSCAPSAISSPA